MPPLARRQGVLCVPGEGVSEAQGLVASLADHKDVRRLTGGPPLTEPELGSVTGSPFVHVLDPGELVEVASFTGDKETGGKNGWLSDSLAVRVDIPSLVGAVRVCLQLEESVLDLRQKITLRTPHPTREGRDRYS